jgi:CRISPR system Cascade subunit CasD
VTTLLLRLSGPMQSWGVHSRYDERDTAFEPSKSGVIGLLCAAAGIARDDMGRIAELAALDMVVRVDREGRLEKDYQTAGGGSWPGLDKYHVIRADGSRSGPGCVTSNRYYLSDAEFLVALGGPAHLLEVLHNALADPVWPLYMGRKGYVASKPIWLRDGLVGKDPMSALRCYPWEPRSERSVPSQIRLVVECDPEEGQRRMDVPICYEQGRRSFAPRYVKNLWFDPTKWLLSAEEVGECTCQD